MVDDGHVLTYNPYMDPWYTYDYDSWMEYNAAVENALESGAVMVDNELELKNRSQGE